MSAAAAAAAAIAAAASVAPGRTPVHATRRISDITYEISWHTNPDTDSGAHGAGHGNGGAGGVTIDPMVREEAVAQEAAGQEAVAQQAQQAQETGAGGNGDPSTPSPSSPSDDTSVDDHEDEHDQLVGNLIDNPDQLEVYFNYVGAQLASFLQQFAGGRGARRSYTQYTLECRLVRGRPARRLLVNVL